MNQSETQNLQAVGKFSNYHFLKRALQFVLSVTLFSFFIWYSSGFSILPQSFNAYFSTCLFSLFTRTLERKYMFLICNGILAFLAKSSLSSSPVPSISAFEIQFQTPNNQSGAKKPVSENDIVVSLESLKSLENGPLMAEEEEEEEEEEEGHNKEVSDEEQEGTENETSVSKQEQGEVKKEEDDGDDDDEEGTESEVLVKQYDETDTEILGNEEIVNADELNRKFEEFIRKMKEEIRIEAQQQLIAV